MSWIGDLTKGKKTQREKRIHDLEGAWPDKEACWQFVKIVLSFDIDVAHRFWLRFLWRLVVKLFFFVAFYVTDILM
jgi:hypothetical protein